EAGELKRTHGVEKIFHAAAVVGQVGGGYTPVSDLGMCVQNALEMADTEEFENVKLKSILFPLMGTGTGRGNLEKTARELIEAALSYLEANPQCRIQQVYFLARNEKDLEVCQHILQENPDVVID